MFKPKHGFIPVVQLSYYETDTTIWTNPKKAAKHLLKKVVSPLHQKGVTYFVIGNEPNAKYTTLNDHFHPQNEAQGIYEYISEISGVIRGQYNDVFLLGPELSYYDNRLVDQLIGEDTTAGNFNILPHIDFFTFHYYPFGNERTTPVTIRDDIINKIRGNYHLEGNLQYLSEKISDFNAINGSDVGIAITEANLCYDNGNESAVEGFGAGGFLAGQFWAEVMAVCMSTSVSFINFWSVIEGTATTDTDRPIPWETDIGYISSQPGNNYRSTFYHFQLMASNFKGDFEWAEISQVLLPASVYRIKAFAANHADGVSVMVMNQDDIGGTINPDGSINIEIRLDTTPFQAGTEIGIRVDFGINNLVYTDVIFPQETILFLFEAGTGNFTSKLTYNIENNRANEGPQ